MKSSHGCGTVHKQLIRELKKRRFWMTHVNRKWVFFLTYLHATKCVLLCTFTLIKRNCQKIWEKLLPSNAKRSLPVDVRRSKTSLFKFPINPLSPKSDQHQISPCNYQCFVKQSGHENYGHDHTRWIRWICLIFYQFLPTTSVGNE